jgi:hypothetical protein
MLRCDVRLKREASVPVLCRRAKARGDLLLGAEQMYVARGHLREPVEPARNAEDLRLYILPTSVLASGRPP